MTGGTATEAPETRKRVMRTLLFFGDSNTRGFGVGREHRYAANVEAALSPTMGTRWRFVVSTAVSDLRVIPEHLFGAVTKHRPDILVWQCPTGPLAYFPRYPEWMRPLRAAHEAMFTWQQERNVRREQRRAPADRDSRRDVLYDGHFVDALSRWRPAAWPATRRIYGWAASRYGLIVKATRERYLGFMAEHRDRLRAETDAHLLFIGPVPHSDYMYPGYGERVLAWSPDLARLLHRPSEGSVYVDVYERLAAHPRRHLLSDGTHLDSDGHSQLGAIVVSALTPLMCAHEDEPERTG